MRKTQVRAPAKLPQRRRFFFAAFQLEHHSFDVPVILVPSQELVSDSVLCPLKSA
jgi:hypothetical protein